MLINNNDEANNDAFKVNRVLNMLSIMEELFCQAQNGVTDEYDDASNLVDVAASVVIYVYK